MSNLAKEYEKKFYQAFKVSCEVHIIEGFFDERPKCYIIRPRKADIPGFVGSLPSSGGAFTRKRMKRKIHRLERVIAERS